MQFGMSTPRPPQGYLPIAAHGLIGDMRTAALVGSDGTVDWLCMPRFDAPSVFAAILDRQRGGAWQLCPTADRWESRQSYLGGTNVLVTRFITDDGVVEVEDLLAVEPYRPGPCLIRRVRGIRGRVPMRGHVEPRFDYARTDHTTVVGETGAVFTPQAPSSDAVGGMALAATVPVEATARGVAATWDTEPGVTVGFALHPSSTQPAVLTDDELDNTVQHTIEHWLGWLEGCTYTGRWREVVHRSALTLKMLTYGETGAIVAAPTTSLPEQMGGPRNWDYRFTWARDSALTVSVLLRLGFAEEAHAFGNFLMARALAPGASLPMRIMFTIAGEHDLPEETLDHLEGHGRSAPVRIGNDAADQLQLDVYGELLEALNLNDEHVQPIGIIGWEVITQVIDWLSAHWDEPDEGVWETRGGRRRFTYSALMSWVAFDRALRIAERRSLPADSRWRTERDRVRHALLAEGRTAAGGAFAQYLGGDVLDASVLQMPMVGFVSPRDPVWLQTLDAISETLVSDSLVYRYDPAASPDGLAGDEGTFSMCSFWYVEALARAGDLQAARWAFEKMLTYANHVGLFSEEIGSTGDQLGNFPQAFTHLALVSAAMTLDAALNEAGVR